MENIIIVNGVEYVRRDEVEKSIKVILEEFENKLRSLADKAVNNLKVDIENNLV